MPPLGLVDGAAAVLLARVLEGGAWAASKLVGMVHREIAQPRA